MSLLRVVAATVFVGLIPLVGGLLLLLSERTLDRILTPIVAFAAGTLMGGAFLHLLPESSEALGSTAWLVVLVGFCAFYVLEDLVGWHHHHDPDHDVEPVSSLILVSDTLHNGLDGVVIGGAFAVSTPLGLLTTAIIAIHEVPQELGDMGVLLNGGVGRRRALVLNLFTQSSAVLGGVVGFLATDVAAGVAPSLLAFAAGAFVYIASSDLIPEVKRDRRRGRSTLHFGVFVGGLLVMWALTFFEPPV